MNDYNAIDKHDPITDCDCRECALAERDRLRRKYDTWGSLAQSLAIELECFLLSCNDAIALTRHWQSAHDVVQRYHDEVNKLLAAELGIQQ